MQIRHDDLCNAAEVFRTASSAATTFLAAETPKHTTNLAVAVSEVATTTAALAADLDSGICTRADTPPEEALQKLRQLAKHVTELKVNPDLFLASCYVPVRAISRHVMTSRVWSAI